MQISKIKRIGNTNRFHVYVDEKWYGIFLDEILVRYNLRTNQEVENLSEIKDENDEKLAFDMAVGYCEKYVVSEKGLKDYLKKKGFSPKICQKTLQKMHEYGFIDDQKFAKNYFESLSSSKGKRAIATKLRQKGVSEQIIGEILQNVSEDDELEKATVLAEKFAKNRENSPKLYQKCLAHLIYKGYDYSVAQKAAKKIYQGEEDDRV